MDDIKLEPGDSRLWIVAAAGALRADQVWTENGWRKAPCQCPILIETIKGATPREMVALMDAWALAYRARCHEYEQAALAT